MRKRKNALNTFWTVLLSALVLLSQPPKLKKEDGTEEPADSGIGEATAAEESL